MFFLKKNNKNISLQACFFLSPQQWIQVLFKLSNSLVLSTGGIKKPMITKVNKQKTERCEKKKDICIWANSYTKSDAKK